jgi:hypothetical protein
MKFSNEQKRMDYLLIMSYEIFTKNADNFIGVTDSKNTT